MATTDLSTSPPRLAVHEVHRPPAPVLRFVDQVAGDGAEELDFRFSRSVLTEFDVDVVHVLDSQLDALLGTKNAGSFQRMLATRALTRNLRKHRIALVRTLPGADVDGDTSFGQSFAGRMLDGATTAFVVFDDSTPTPDASRTTVIPHAHFRERLSGYPRADMVEGRMLCIARGRLTAKSRSLLGIPRVTSTAGMSVRLAGEADAQLEVAIRSAVARHRDRVSARLERLSDGARVQEIDAAELVVVPEVSSISDLQTVFLALSLDRPVVVPRTAQMVALAEEAGPGWLHLVDSALTPTFVDEVFASVRGLPDGASPELAGRGLPDVRAKYAAVLRGAARQVESR